MLLPHWELAVRTVANSLPKEKNLVGQFQYFQITQPGSSAVTPLYQLRRFLKFYVVFFPPLLQTGFKNWRNSTLQYKFGGRFGISQMVGKKACAALWRIFSSNKRAPSNRKR
jgi:hypothetical protein